jgi:hypothetical protein
LHQRSRPLPMIQMSTPDATSPSARPHRWWVAPAARILSSNCRSLPRPLPAWSGAMATICTIQSICGGGVGAPNMRLARTAGKPSLIRRTFPLLGRADACCTRQAAVITPLHESVGSPVSILGIMAMAVWSFGRYIRVVQGKPPWDFGRSSALGSARGCRTGGGLVK